MENLIPPIVEKLETTEFVENEEILNSTEFVKNVEN